MRWNCCKCENFKEKIGAAATNLNVFLKADPDYVISVHYFIALTLIGLLGFFGYWLLHEFIELFLPGNNEQSGQSWTTKIVRVLVILLFFLGFVVCTLKCIRRDLRDDHYSRVATVEVSQTPKKKKKRDTTPGVAKRTEAPVNATAASTTPTVPAAPTSASSPSIPVTVAPVTLPGSASPAPSSTRVSSSGMSNGSASKTNRDVLIDLRRKLDRSRVTATRMGSVYSRDSDDDDDDDDDDNNDGDNGDESESDSVDETSRERKGTTATTATGTARKQPQATKPLRPVASGLV